MDRNSSGSVFCWPDAGGSWPGAVGLHEQCPEPGTGGRAPYAQTQGWELTPHCPSGTLWAGQGRAGCQHLAGVCLLGTAASDPGRSVTPTRGRRAGHFYTSFFFLLIWISCSFTCKPLVTKWIVIYSELLATPSNQGKPHQKKKLTKFVGSLVASTPWSQLGRRWLTPLSPCLDAREEQGSWETPNTVWSRISLKQNTPSTLHCIDS